MNPESLDSVLAKRNSFAHMWELLEVKPAYRDLYNQFMIRWNRLSHRRQQQFYWFLREKKRRGEKLYENPLYNLIYVNPHPYNWNGKNGIESMLRSSTKMVSAFYEGKCGIYTLCEATIFEMTHVQRLN